MKRKSTEKLEKIKALFEKAGVEISDDQVQTFVSTFELQKNEAIAEAVKPVQAKVEEYQKRNYELAGALEAANQFKDNFEKVLEEKVKQIQAIKVPEIPKIEEAISKPLTEKLNLLEKKIVKIDEAANKINEKILPLNMAEDLKQVTELGTLFSNYKQEFAKHLVDMESAEIKKLKEEVDILKKKALEAEKNTKNLEEQIVSERANTEITLLLENSPLDKDEKEHLYKYYEKLGFEEGKTEIQKFIKIKENKERERPVQRSFVRESGGGVKPMNEIGTLRKATRLGESSSFARQLDEWAGLARIDDSEQHS
jgi:hypothetical protein